jgi:hypothetical protein
MGSWAIKENGKSQKTIENNRFFMQNKFYTQNTKK